MSWYILQLFYVSVVDDEAELTELQLHDLDHGYFFSVSATSPLALLLRSNTIKLITELLCTRLLGSLETSLKASSSEPNATSEAGLWPVAPTLALVMVL